MLDRCASKKHLLLLDHLSGIDPNIISSLLLPQCIDMNIAYDLEQYFGERNRNAAQTNPSLIDERTVSQNSFSSKYAQQNNDMTATMTAIRQDIMKADRENLAKMKVEWQEGRQRADNLRAQANRLSCEYFDSQWGGKTHSYSCIKCRLNDEADAIKILRYEHLLPESICMQNAIVFELAIPEELACLRDALFEFTRYCTGTSDDTDIKFKWNTNRLEISKHNQSTSARVWLGSETKFEPTTLHVDNLFDSFHVRNKSDCIFYADDDKKSKTDGSEAKKTLLASFKDDTIKNACTFKTNNKCLRWTLESTNHFQNEVLSRQSDCPQEISLSEYKNFGSLRADGHRLQLWKLYAIIETEALPFEKESVLLLIMQTLWQCGISGDSADIRESHDDFNDPIFCAEFIKLLKKFVGEQKSNWQHPFKIIMAVLIAVRAFEINADASVADEIVELLNRVRSILLQWIDDI